MWTFATLTDDLLALAGWLSQHHVTHVAMESIGVLWKPIWNILESYDFTLLLVNARELKQVPGRGERRQGFSGILGRPLSGERGVCWQTETESHDERECVVAAGVVRVGLGEGHVLPSPIPSPSRTSGIAWLRGNAGGA